MNRFVALTVGLLLSPLPAFSQDSPRPDLEHADSLASAYARAYARAARTMTSPELEHRKALRRSLQQRGYAAALQSSLESDGVSAILAILRTHLHVALHIPHTPITLHIPIEQQPSWDEKLPGYSAPATRYFEITLAEDWSFPDDPWSAR